MLSPTDFSNRVIDVFIGKDEHFLIKCSILNRGFNKTVYIEQRLDPTSESFVSIIQAL